MTPIPTNPTIVLTKQKICEILCNGIWCIFWADGLICPRTGKKISLHRYLTIPIKPNQVLLFSITTEDPQNPKENIYKKYPQQQNKIKGLIYFQKKDWPHNTFDKDVSVTDLNNYPIEKTFEEIVSYQPCCIEEHFSKEKKELVLDYLISRNDLPGNIKTALTEIYCSL